MSHQHPESRRSLRAAQRQREEAETNDSKPFSVLFVCSGNICRSPLGEQLLRARTLAIFGGDAPAASREVVFSSAGTIAAAGQRMPEQAAELSVRYGGEPSLHRATELDAQLVGAADLVIAMAQEHRSGVVRSLPRSSRYTFTLREFAALMRDLAQVAAGEKLLECGPDIPAQLRALIPAVAARRGMGSVLSPEDSDVVDPYRRSQATYDKSGEQVVTAVDEIMAALDVLGWPNGAPGDQ